MAGGKHITKPCQWRNQHAEESQDQVVLLLNLQSEPRQAELTP